MNNKFPPLDCAQETVTLAIGVERQIVALKKQLAEYKLYLMQEASDEEYARTPTEGGGFSVTFSGQNGELARVTVPGDKLKSQIDPESKVFLKIKKHAGKFFLLLFENSLMFKPINGFRAKAAELLGKDAAKLIKLCQSDSEPKVTFETKTESLP